MNFNFQTQKQIWQKGRAAASEGSPRHGSRTQTLWVQTVLRRFPFERNSAAWAQSGSESRSNVRWNHQIASHFKTPRFKATPGPGVLSADSNPKTMWSCRCRPSNDVQTTDPVRFTGCCLITISVSGSTKFTCSVSGSKTTVE